MWIASSIYMSAKSRHQFCPPIWWRVHDAAFVIQPTKKTWNVYVYIREWRDAWCVWSPKINRSVTSDPFCAWARRLHGVRIRWNITRKARQKRGQHTSVLPLHVLAMVCVPAFLVSFSFSPGFVSNSVSPFIHWFLISMHSFRFSVVRQEIRLQSSLTDKFHYAS